MTQTREEPGRATAPFPGGPTGLFFGLPPVPNLITLFRTVGAMVLAGWAAATSSLTLLVIGYALYWAGDSADGVVARLRDERTRTGAVFDIISDRACTTMLGTAFLVQRPSMAVPLVVYLVQFCVVDTMLTLGFLRWPIDSPNDFHVVDPLLYKLNWSIPAKSLNTMAVVLLVLSGNAVLATCLALAVASVKVWGVFRLVRLLREREPLSPALAIHVSGPPRETG